MGPEQRSPNSIRAQQGVVQPVVTRPTVAAQQIEAPAPQATNGIDSSTSVLSYEEIRKLGSWSDVKEIYQARGHLFYSDEQYLSRAKADWNIIRSSLFTKAQSAPLPSEFPHESVVIDEKRIDVIGICHSSSVHPDILVLLAAKLNRYPWLLAEQNLGVMNYGLHSHGLDLPDHFARGVLHAVGEDERRQLQGIINWFVRKARILTPQETTGEVHGDDFLRPTTAQARAVARLQERFGIRDETIMAYSRLALTVPGDWLQDLPTNVELAYKHEKNLPYTMSQARSAFMAEFLRRWDVARTIKNSGANLTAEQHAELVSCKGIVCGQAHQPEIIFFLKHGSKEDRVIAQAQRAANALSESGAQGIVSMHRRNNSLLWACKAPIAIAKGMLLGSLVSWAGWSLLF